MTKTIDVVYEGGILRPLQTLDWQEGKCYTLIMETKASVAPPDPRPTVEIRTEIAASTEPHTIHEQSCGG